jgi:glycerol kinase
MQLLADLLDRRIVRPRVTEASALGVARLASEALGLAGHEGGSEQADYASPAMAGDERETIRRKWADAVALAMAAAETGNAARATRRRGCSDDQ